MPGLGALNISVLVLCQILEGRLDSIHRKPDKVRLHIGIIRFAGHVDSGRSIGEKLQFICLINVHFVDTVHIQVTGSNLVGRFGASGGIEPGTLLLTPLLNSLKSALVYDAASSQKAKLHLFRLSCTA